MVSDYNRNRGVSSFQAVQDNETKQLEFATSVDSSDISDYYPELHKSDIGGDFSNNVVGNYVADVATSPCVIVDLKTWPTENDMISEVGMDLAFLEALRERGRVVLSANLPSSEYQNCGWMFSVLADSRTLFRNSRTPQFFQTVLRHRGFDFNSEREGLETEIKEKVPWDSAVATLDTLSPGQPPKSMDQYARQVSHWVTRIAATGDFDEFLDIKENFTSDPANVAQLIKPLQLCRTNVVSGGLGGNFHRVSGLQLRSAFPDTFDEFESMTADLAIKVVSPEVLDFLEKNIVPGDVEDIYNPEVWSAMSEETRTNFLFRLSADSHMKKDRRVVDDARRAIVNADTEALGSMSDVLEDAARRVDEKFEILNWAVPVALAVPTVAFGWGWWGALGISAAWYKAPKSRKQKLLADFIAGYDIVDLMRRKPGQIERSD